MPNNTPITAKEQDMTDRLYSVWLKKKAPLGLSQERAADMFGCTQANISQYLNGKIPLNTDAIFKFAKILQVAPEEINPNIGEIVPFTASGQITASDMLPVLGKMPLKEVMKFLGMAEAIIDQKLKEQSEE
jgi:predicted transcriptional regulator